MIARFLTPFGPRQILPAIVITNVGLLAALLSGPNSGHPNALVARLGIGVLAVGLLLLVGVALSRKPSPPRGLQR